MKRRKWQFLSGAAVLGLMLLATGGVRGDTILDLSTGFASTGAPPGVLQTPGGVDANWTVTAVNQDGSSFTPPLTTPQTKVLDTSLPVINGPWIPNTTASQWITPNDPRFTEADAPPPDGSYSSSNLLLTYKNTFTVSGSGDVIVGKVTIDPRATSDNDLISYTLTGPGVSGVPVTISPTTGSTPFHGWVSLPTIALPDAGTYTLSFVVVNRAQTGGNPSGFRAEALVATPEPASVGMMATAVVVFAGYGLRRRMKKS